jgi:tyrosine-protein phosphatase YwqE
MKERAEKMQIDLGGNLLPGFVGGSKDIESCAERLRILYSAGIAAAVLTPRYYPAKMSVTEFLALRKKILLSLDGNMPRKCPALYLGSEVYLDERLKYISDIGSLAILGTRTIIVDMPTGVWENALLDTLYAIKMADYEVLIAHIDRCPEGYVKDLFSLGYKGLIDASALLGMTSIFRRRQIFEWIDNGDIVGIGGNFAADEKRAHEKIFKLHGILGEDRALALAESSARYLAGAVQITK